MHYPGKKRPSAAPGRREWKCCCVQRGCRRPQATGLKDAACSVFSLQLCSNRMESWNGRGLLHNYPPENVELIHFEKTPLGGFFAAKSLDQYDSQVALVEQWETCEDGDDVMEVLECRETLGRDRVVKWETCYEYDKPVEVLDEIGHETHRQQDGSRTSVEMCETFDGSHV